MHHSWSVAVVISQFFASGSDTQAPRNRVERDKRTATQKATFVGQVWVLGNEATPQNVILRRVPLYPGQRFTQADLRVAERKLARLWCYVFAKGEQRPTVTAIDRDDGSAFRDILIQVHEGPQTLCLWRVVDTTGVALDIRCRHIVFGYLTLVPRGPQKITLAGYFLGDAACSWLNGDRQEANRAINIMLWALSLDPDWPENPAPPS